MSRWWADDEQMMSGWWSNDKQMMSRWWADDERMMSWWWADDERMMSGWWTDFFFSFDILLAKASRWQQAAAELHKYFLDDESIHRRGLDLKNVYLSTKKFTPDLQIFYTFLVFGLNVHVLGVKVPPNAMKRIIFIKLYPTSKRRMLLSENLPQTSRFFTRIYPQYLWHFTTLLPGHCDFHDMSSQVAIVKNVKKNQYWKKNWFNWSGYSGINVNFLYSTVDHWPRMLV